MRREQVGGEEVGTGVGEAVTCSGTDELFGSRDFADRHQRGSTDHQGRVSVDVARTHHESTNPCLARAPANPHNPHPQTHEDDH